MGKERVLVWVRKITEEQKNNKGGRSFGGVREASPKKKKKQKLPQGKKSNDKERKRAPKKHIFSPPEESSARGVRRGRGKDLRRIAVKTWLDSRGRLGSCGRYWGLDDIKESSRGKVGIGKGSQSLGGAKKKRPVY